MTDLRTRVPGQSLIEELLRQWDRGTIHVDQSSNGIVIDEEAESWYRGVLGERRVAALLDQLGEEWTVIHSLPIGERGSDIDHLVIGPPGVFTVNTKFSPGRSVWVAGTKINVERVPKPHIRNLLTEARRASNYLSEKSGMTVAVTGLLVFVDPSTVIIKEVAGGGEVDPPIRVLRDSELLGALNGRREYSDEQLRRIVDAAVRPTTWSQRGSDGWSLTGAESTSGANLAREFEALEQEVGPRLELPRGQVRSSATRPTALARSGRRPASTSRPRSTSSQSRNTRSRRKKPVWERLLTELVFPIASLALTAWILQQVFTSWIASK
jgi:hypothetical protein